MELMDVIKQRRSVRRYTDEKVSVDTIKECIEAAILAPTGSNAQQWDFVIVSDDDMRREVANLIIEGHREYWSSARKEQLKDEKLDKVMGLYESMKKVPIFVLFCVNMRNQVLVPEYQDYGKLWAEHSLAAAIENFILAATEKGLGTCWFGAPTFKENEYKKILGIPEDVKIRAIVPVGHIDGNPGTRPRLASEVVTHVDRW